MFSPSVWNRHRSRHWHKFHRRKHSAVLSISHVFDKLFQLFSSSLAGWATSFFSISLAQNIITTCLIVYRIWRVNMDVARGPGSRSLWPVISVILESGAIYSSTLLVLLATYASGSFAQYIALDMLVPIIGITFNLIIVRVGLGISSGGSKSGGRNMNPMSTEPTIGRFPLQRLNITVQKSVTVDNDIERAQISAQTKVDDGSASFDEWESGKKAPVAM